MLRCSPTSNPMPSFPDPFCSRRGVCAHEKHLPHSRVKQQHRTRAARQSASNRCSSECVSLAGSRRTVRCHTLSSTPNAAAVFWCCCCATTTAAAGAMSLLHHLARLGLRTHPSWQVRQSPIPRLLPVSVGLESSLIANIHCLLTPGCQYVHRGIISYHVSLFSFSLPPLHHRSFR